VAINAATSPATYDAGTKTIGVDVSAITIAASQVTGTAVVTSDSRLSDARTPTAHTHAIADSTGLQTALDGKAATSHTHNVSQIVTTVSDKSANYTIVAADENTFIRSTGSAITITIANVLAVGESVQFAQDGAGQITFTPGNGVTLQSVDSKRKTNKQYSGATVICVASGQYRLYGDLAA
jgi:RNase H-fold protein (predicted Holliday junction resolvase)